MKKRTSKPAPVAHSSTGCANCGATVSGTYCSSCGQKHSDLHRPLSELSDELLDTLNLDKRILRTIVPFILKPGFLTIEYLDGRRKRYTSPLRLYLLMSLIFFFLAQHTSKSDRINKDIANFTISNDTANKVIVNDSIALQILENDSLLMSFDDTTGTTEGIRKAETNKRFFEAILKATTDKSLFLTSFYKNISYILFILMPAFAMILKLLYIRRKRFYIEHLIFSLNMHSFALLLFSIIIIVKLIFPGAGNGISLAIILLPVYFTSGMRRFYKQGLAKTIIKEVILAAIYIILLLISIFIVLAITLYFL